MNASEHIAKPNAPRANGSGALPSQHTGSHPGAVNRRASQTSRSTGRRAPAAATRGRAATASGGRSRRRCRWRAAVRRAPCRATARTTALRRRCRSGRRSDRESSRLRSPVPAPRRCRGRWPCRTRRRRSNARGLLLVVEADHRRGARAPAGRPRCARARSSAAGCRCRTGMPATTGKMQQWQPRMPSWISSASRRWNSESTSSSRPPQYGHRRMSSVFDQHASNRARCSRIGSPLGADASARRNCSTPEPAPRLVLVDQANGLPAPICVRWQRSAASFAAPSRARRRRTSAARRRRRTHPARCPRSSSRAARRPWRARPRRPRA